MKPQLVILILAAALIQISNSQPTSKPSASSSSDEDDDMTDVVEEMLKACKAKGCKKDDILKEVQAAVDVYMKTVKPGELNRVEVLKDIDTLAKAKMM